MAKYLLTGDGRRLLTGGGAPLMADAPGSAWSEIEAVPATIRVTGSASPIALVALSAVTGLISITGAAQPSATVTADLAPAVISITGSASPDVESMASGTIRVTATAQIGADVWLTPAPAVVKITGSASPTAVIGIEAMPAAIRITGTAENAVGVRDAWIEAAPATIRLTGSAAGAQSIVSLAAAPAVIRITGTASPSVNTNAKYRSYWLQAYENRQAVLNAIDANNRFLAKSAGDKAQAAADAIIITNTRVDEVDGKVVAEAQRITLLTANVDDLGATVLSNQQAQVAGDEALAARLDQTALDLDGKASTESLNAQISRITQNEQGVEANSIALAQVSADLVGKASTAAVNLLESYVREDVDGRVSANSAAITQVKAEAQTPFTSDYGWEFLSNNRGFTVSGAVLQNFPLTQDDGATAIVATDNDPNFTSPVFSQAGGAHPVVRAMVRRRNATAWQGALYWANNQHGISGSYVATTSTPLPDVGVWTVVEWDMRSNTDWRTGGPLNQLRFDFGAEVNGVIDVKWIALGNYGQGRSAQATQTLKAEVDASTGIARAIHGVTLDVNGYVSGTRSENDGTKSSFSILADRFAVASPSGQGLTWENGVMVMRANGVMTATGGPFGVNNEFIRWFGPDVSLSACARENALSFETKDGIPYFGGLLTKEGQTRTASSAGFGNGTLTCPSHPSNGGRKKISVLLSRSNNGYMQGNVAPAEGGIGSAFQATFDLQRKIGAGDWASIKTHTSNSSVQGTAEYEPEFSSTHFSASGSGGLAFEDTNAAVDTVQYRVVYTVSGGPLAYSTSANGFPLNKPSTQSTKITVIEDAPF